MEKNLTRDLRNNHKRFRNQMLDFEHSKKSADIVRNLLALLESDFKGANIFLCYYPFGSEIDLIKLYEALLEKGSLLFFPVSDVKEHRLHFYQITDLKQDFHKGAFDIMEPNEGLPEFEYKHFSNNRFDNIICITPGLVFDFNFNRIGYGAGFYDRFFEDKNDILKIAPCFENQLEALIPVKEHDIKMDIILTEERVLKTVIKGREI